MYSYHKLPANQYYAFQTLCISTSTHFFFLLGVITLFSELLFITFHKLTERLHANYYLDLLNCDEFFWTIFLFYLFL